MTDGSSPAVLGAAAPRRIAAIVNPTSRGGAAGLERIVRQAAPVGVHVEVLTSNNPGDAVRLAHEASGWADRVVAVGGDGTVADVATGLVGRRVPLAIVPAGSTNIVAKELGLPVSRRASARIALRSTNVVARDLGRCGERCFLHMAGAGVDSHFFQHTDRQLKKRFGWVAYLPAALAAFQLPPARFSIRVDEERIEALTALVVVANGAAVITPNLRLHSAVASDDGWLDLLVFTATDPPAIAKTLALLAAGRLDDSPLLLTRKARQIDVAADPSLPVQLDGDVVARTPVSFSVVPGGIDLVRPEGRPRHVPWDTGEPNSGEPSGPRGVRRTNTTEPKS